MGTRWGVRKKLFDQAYHVLFDSHKMLQMNHLLLFVPFVTRGIDLELKMKYQFSQMVVIGARVTAIFDVRVMSYSLKS